jgi:LacI family transcriptional regulator
MPLTLDDIARMAGVSRSTVSRVLNGSPFVNERTREHVLGVIQSVNFQPNLAARGLAVGRTGVIGLVIPSGVGALFTDPYFPRFVQGVSSACSPRDYSVMLWLAEPEYERRTIRQILYNGLVDGVIVASMQTDDAIVEALAEHSLPFLLIGRHPARSTLNYIDVENRSGAAAAARRLLAAGRRRIAAIHGPHSMIAGLDRRQGFEDELRAAGLPPESALTREADFSEAGGYQAMRDLLSQRPDALFAASDAMALGAMRAAQEAGLSIPDGLAVIGFDDIPAAAVSSPPLTTMRQPIQQSGAAAAETLIDIIAHPQSQPRQVVLPVELVERDSCPPAFRA